MIFDFDIDAMIWNLIRKYVSSSDLEREDDLFSIAKHTAILALAKYDATKNVKLSTYIYSCVRNRLVDTKRLEQKRVKLKFVDDYDGYDEGKIPHDEYEFNQTMKAILSPDEYKIFWSVFVEDFPLSHSYQKFGKYKAGQCYNNIISKFLTLEKSHVAILTHRKRQEQFANCSNQ